MGASRRAPDPVLSRRSLFGLRPAPVSDVSSVAVIATQCLSMMGTTCRICAEHCEAGAIRFRLGLGGKSTPVVSEACDGCAGCRPVCPVGAITLEPRPEVAPCA